MFDLGDAYVWDFWVVDDGEDFHLFFLHAPGDLAHADLRHDHARIGHATSPDLLSWRRVSDPLPSRVEGFDDLAQWTGCVVRDGEGWRMLTTGRTGDDGGRAQRIGSATSVDLMKWHRDTAVLEADPRFYEMGPGEVHWRDPWVVPDGDGRWHLYATARTGGPGSGVVGHAVSEDLRTWTVRPPLSTPTGRFDWLEVIRLVEVEGRWVLLFNCLSAEMPGSSAGAGGIWSVPVAGPGTPVDVESAVRLTDESRYVGQPVRDRSGRWQLLAFRNVDESGDFVGGVADPVPVEWRPDGLGLRTATGGGAPERLA